MRQWYFGTGMNRLRTCVGKKETNLFEDKRARRKNETKLRLQLKRCASLRDLGTHSMRFDEGYRLGAVSLRWLRAFSILLVQIRVPIGRASQLAFDEQIFHLGLQLERIAARYDQVGELPCFKGS